LSRPGLGGGVTTATDLYLRRGTFYVLRP